jgi:hypothetical protein
LLRYASRLLLLLLPPPRICTSGARKLRANSQELTAATSW